MRQDSGQALIIVIIVGAVVAAGSYIALDRVARLSKQAVKDSAAVASDRVTSSAANVLKVATSFAAPPTARNALVPAHVPSIYPDPYIFSWPTRLQPVRPLGGGVSGSGESYNVRIADLTRPTPTDLSGAFAALPSVAGGTVASVTIDRSSLVPPPGKLGIKSVRATVVAQVPDDQGKLKTSRKTVSIPLETPPDPDCQLTLSGAGSPGAPLWYGSAVTWSVACKGVVAMARLHVGSDPAIGLGIPAGLRSVRNELNAGYTALASGVVGAKQSGGSKMGPVGGRYLRQSIWLEYQGVDDFDLGRRRTTAPSNYYVWAMPTCRVNVTPNPALSDDVVYGVMQPDDSSPIGGGPMTFNLVWNGEGETHWSWWEDTVYPPPGWHNFDGAAYGPGYPAGLNCTKTWYPVEPACRYLRASYTEMLQTPWGYARRIPGQDGSACSFVNDWYWDGDDWYQCGGDVRCLFSTGICGRTPFWNALYVRIKNANSRYCYLDDFHWRWEGCFRADTLITMADGEERPITQVNEGDNVFNPATGRPARVKRKRAGPEEPRLWDVVTDHGTVHVTSKHAFVTARGVVAAEGLQAGDVLVSEDNGNATVQAVAEGEHTDKYVYNLELDAPSDAPAEHMLLANGVPTGDLLLQTTRTEAKKDLRAE